MLERKTHSSLDWCDCDSSCSRATTNPFNNLNGVFLQSKWNVAESNITILKNLTQEFKRKKLNSSPPPSLPKTMLNSHVIFSVIWRATSPGVGGGGGGQQNHMMCFHNQITWQSLNSFCLDCGLIDEWHS